MLDHIGLSVSDFARAKAFYEKALAPLGFRVVMEVTKADSAGRYEGAGFGDTKPIAVSVEQGRKDRRRRRRYGVRLLAVIAVYLTHEGRIYCTADTDTLPQRTTPPPMPKPPDPPRCHPSFRPLRRGDGMPKFGPKIETSTDGEERRPSLDSERTRRIGRGRLEAAEAPSWVQADNSKSQSGE